MSLSLNPPFSAGAPLDSATATASRLRCPNCDEDIPAHPFYTIPRLPIHSCLLVPTREEAVQFPKGSLRLVDCSACGFVWNSRFEPERMRYSPDYEEIQSCSPRFREFQTSLVRQLINKYGLHGKRVVEIGCGKGDFLREFCREAQAVGVGIDPSYRGAENVDGESVQFVREFYGPEHANFAADFVCCRHTLEHIAKPLEFLRLVARSLDGRPDAIVCFEVPDLERVLCDGAFWDVYYEHCSYYTTGTIARLFRTAGFEVLDVYKEFDDQYLMIEGRVRDGSNRRHHAEEAVSEVQEWVRQFQTTVAACLTALADMVDDRIADGQSVVLWGGGSKAVSLLTSLRNQQAIRHVVDVNPVKHGKFIPGTGQEVVAPQRLIQLRPDVVVIMNGIYRNEIAATLRDMNIAPELIEL